MDPFTIALAVFGVSKLTGSSTKNALKNAFLAGTGSYAVGASTSAGALGGFGQGEAFSGITSLLSAAPTAATGVETGVGVGTGLNTAAATAPDYYGLATNSGTPITSAFDYTAVTPKATNFFDKWFQSAKEEITLCGDWNNLKKQCSDDERCLGHRHDQTTASIIAYQLEIERTNPHFMQYDFDGLETKENTIFNCRGIC